MQHNGIVKFGLRFISSRPRPGISFQQQALNCAADIENFFSAPEGGQRTFPCHLDGTLRIVSEQAPNPPSRVTLGKQPDRFGKRRIDLNWRMSDIDKKPSIMLS